ncbi:flippase-like domain-containing protein, partial [Myxococcota bacterium]|nr:flippase-like domain-containing protein [Myxococcota bacterium]
MNDESSTSSGMKRPARARWIHRILDWRIWLGLMITVVSIGWAIRGIPIRDVVDAMEGANFWALLLYSAPFYTASVYVRSLRWRHLTNPIAPIARPLLFRAESLGFMVNNLLPLRVGEVVRSWTLAQDSGTSTSAIFGTVVLERVLDVVSVLALAGGALAYVGRSSDVGGLLAEGSFLLLPVGAAPLVVLILMKVAPDFVIRISHRIMVLLPLSIREKVEALLRSFIEGLGALSGGRHLFWIVF